MKVSLKWFLTFAVALTALFIFQTNLHSQSAGTIKWANTSSSCSGSPCLATMSWSPSAFSDTNYTAVCSAIQGSSTMSLSIESETASQITVWLQDASLQGASLSSYGFQCIAVHN